MSLETIKISRVFQDREVSFECIEKNQKILETLKCPICLDFFKEPLMAACGHNLCKDCTKKFPEKKCSEHIKCSLFKCPMCREQIHSSMFTKNINLASTIDVIQVRCQQNLTSVRGLESIPEVGNIQCSKEIYLEGIEHHLKNECENCIVNYQYECGYKNIRSLKVSHELVCLKNPETKIPCPDCSESVFAILLEEHKKNECSESIVSCTVTHLCKKKFKRCELEQHIKNESCEHIKLLKNENCNLYKDGKKFWINSINSNIELKEQEEKFKIELKEQEEKFKTELKKQEEKFKTELKEQEEKQEENFKTELNEIKNKIRFRMKCISISRPDEYMSKSLWQTEMRQIEKKIIDIIDKK